MTAKSCTLQAAVVMIAIAFVRGAKEDVFVSRNMRQAHHLTPACLLAKRASYNTPAVTAAPVAGGRRVAERAPIERHCSP